MDKTSIIVMAVALILSGIMVYEIYILYYNADYVKCDSFGNCIFTTVTRESKIIESRSCYENGKQVNCSANDMKIEIPEGEFPL